MVQSSYHLSSYHLPKEISKLKPFADSLLLHSKKQKRLHNIHRFIFLLVLLAGHIFLSFIIPLLPWWGKIIGIMLSGYFIYFYFVLVVHEGSHSLLFITKNDWIKRFIPAFSMAAGFPSYTVYLRDHITHHNRLLEKEDLQNTSHLNFRKIPLFYFTRIRPPYPLRHFLDNTNLPAFFLAGIIKSAHLLFLFSLFSWSGLFLGFVLPIFLAAVLNAFRVSFRHYGLYPNPKPLRSRSYTFFGSRILGPDGLRYHFEHHLFPKIPSYNLKNLYLFVEKNCSKELVEKVHYKHFKWKDFW